MLQLCSNNRAKTDRPKVIPEHSTNLAFTGEFVEQPYQMVFTEQVPSFRRNCGLPLCRRANGQIG